MITELKNNKKKLEFDARILYIFNTEKRRACVDEIVNPHTSQEVLIADGELFAGEAVR